MITLAIMILASSVIFLAPSRKLKVLSSIYFFLLWVLFEGIAGFINTIPVEDPAYNNSKTAFFAVEVIILILHLPFVFKLYKLDHHKQKVKSARVIFDKEIAHLNDHQLKHNLEHDS